MRRLLAAVLLAALGASWAPVPVSAQDAAAADPLPVVLAYAAALEAQDVARVGATLDDGMRFSGDVCCGSKAGYLAVLPGWWATGVRSRIAVEGVVDDTVTVRARNGATDDHLLGLPPVEVVYEATVRDGRIVALRGAADWGSGQRRDAILVARAAAAQAIAVATQATPTPAVVTGSPSTQARGAQTPGAWLAVAGVSLLGVVLLSLFKRPAAS